jgi:two-component system, sensor histidine kinase and response regulator
VRDTFSEDADWLENDSHHDGQDAVGDDGRTWRILIVDDEKDIHTVTRLALKSFRFRGKRLEIFSAYSAAEGFEFMAREPDIALVLLDVVMESETAGLGLVQRIRQDLQNSMVRIVLRTGQPGVAREKNVIFEYDINDYKAKTELTSQRLFTTVLLSLKAYEAELLRYNEQQLRLERIARKAAEEASRAKSEFLATMSHEIRTPVNAITGMSYLALQARADHQKQHSYVEKVHRSSLGLLGIINDLLDYSKIEAGSLELESIDFSLEQVFLDLAGVLSVKAQEKGLNLLFDVPFNIPAYLVGDPLRLGQILLNLGSNAIKFTSHGEVVLGVALETLAEQGVELRFWVRDTGIGMTPEQIGRLFQSFTQADSSTTRKYGGTGLGLAISKRLVELHGGRIGVRSEPGVGSTFEFSVPLGLQSQQAPDLAEAARALKGRRVLVLDANPSAREIVSSMAAGMGLLAQAAASADEAIAEMSRALTIEQPYDIALIDCKLTQMDGIDLIALTRERWGARAPALVLMSAMDPSGAIEGARRRDVYVRHVLPKPMTSATLLSVIAFELGLQGELTETSLIQLEQLKGTTGHRFAGARLLLVEDNDINLELATDMLKMVEVSVLSATDGQQALNILRHDRQFDGILMDCRMPVLDGYETTQAIRQIPGLEHLPILAMTANSMAGDKERALRSGMNDQITKPFNMVDLCDTLNRWIVPRTRSGNTRPAPLGGA